MLHSRMRWAIKEVAKDEPYRPLIPGLRPGFLEESVPKLAPEPKSNDEKLAEAHPADSIHPPFCLTPDEFPPQGENADIPAVLKSRREKSYRKAEARRNAQRRKIERLGT